MTTSVFWFICHLYVLFSEMFVVSFAHFLMGFFFFFLLLSFEGSLYILDTCPLLDMWLTDISSQSIAYLVILLTTSFTELKFFILSKFSWSIFLFTDHTCTDTPGWERQEGPVAAPHWASPDEEASSDAQRGAGGASVYCLPPLSGPFLTNTTPTGDLGSCPTTWQAPHSAFAGVGESGARAFSEMFGQSRAVVQISCLARLLLF